MSITTITSGENQFYPTPPSIAEKMLEGIDWDCVGTILEPSAGKGDLILAAARANGKDVPWHRLSNLHLHVDAVEIDPYLRQICKYNFSEEKKDEVYQPLGDIRKRGARTEEETAKERMLEQEYNVLKSVDLHIVHDDFLTFNTFKRYSLILMNPPFADGDKHLLKALDMQKNGGRVICLLNAETLLNPYTNTRKVLKQKLEELNAEIEFVEDAFANAERKARVDVAIVRVNIPFFEQESDFFEHMKKTVDEQFAPDEELRALVPADYIEQAIFLYNTELAATNKFIQEYFALSSTLKKLSPDELPLFLQVRGESQYSSFNYNEYMKKVRLKYWNKLFSNEQFMGRLTSNLREKYRNMIDRMADYDFSAFNIKQVMVEMNTEMYKGVQDTIMNLFDKLTNEHTFYNECTKNIHFYNGWKTNKAHKIGKKSIIPAYGLFSEWTKRVEVRVALGVLSDIEKAFDYLDGGYFKGNVYDMESRLKAAYDDGETKNIECTYFLVDLFKKGTIHIKFKPEAMPLVERLNIYAAQNRGWLPPSFGKKEYKDMDKEEKEVIDSFQGEKEYNKVMANKDYYLSVGNTPVLLGGN